MFNKRHTLIILSFLAICAVLAIPPMRSSHNRTLAPGALSLKPEMALAATPPFIGGPLRYIASDLGIQAEVTLTPSSITTEEVLDTSVVASVTVPEDKNRTHLFIAFSGFHSWIQVPSTEPYRFTGNYVITLTSETLPSQGSIRLPFGLDGQIDFQPSTKSASYIRDPAGSFAVDLKGLTEILRSQFGLTQEQASQMAKEVIESEIKIDMSVRVRIRSVESFTLSNSSLQIWGD